MNLNEIIKHFTHNIVDLNKNKWKVIEVSDIEEICKEYHKQQLILSGVSISDSLDMKIKTLEHVDELIEQKMVCFKNIPELQKERIELNAQIKLLRHLKNN